MTNKQLASELASKNIEFLQQCVDRVFANSIDINIPEFQSNSAIFTPSEYEELTTTIHDLETSKQQLSPQVVANLELLKGREEYSKEKIEQSIKNYNKSLALWQRQLQEARSRKVEQATIDHYVGLEAVVLYHLGLSSCRLAQKNSQEESHKNWQIANDYLQQCLDLCQTEKQDHLASKFISKRCEILQHLESWSELQNLAKDAVQLHINHGTEEQLAQDYGFLAEAALKSSRWVHANQLAELALAIQTQVRIEETQTPNSFIYLLSESQQQLTQWQDTVDQLKIALKKTDHQQDLDGYLHILQALNKLYFEQGQYRQASEYKEEYRTLSYQYELHPFIGISQLQSKQSGNQTTNVAPEILASGRMYDVSNLLQRIKSDFHKLTVIHGNSGTGKSSLINAGLVPILLQPEALNNQIVLPIVLRVFTDWLRDPNPATWNLDTVLQNLRKNDDKSLLKVLIFDQFEEFFLICQELSQRLPFYQFMKECLALTSVKVILVMRTEFIYYLLEAERYVQLGSLNIDILSKNVLYYLGNFSTTNAKALLRNLSDHPRFELELELINQLVKDLTIPLAEVRPVELQLVGAQMQVEKITTLAKYLELGSNPTTKLMQKFLEGAIEDCGEENSKTARLVLYCLTTNKEHRVLKTRDQIAKDLLSDAEKLDLVLELLVRSGVVLQLPDIPDDRYQLAHTYLANLIRNQGGKMLIAELELEREKVQRQLTEEKPDSFIDRAIASVFRWLRTD